MRKRIITAFFMCAAVMACMTAFAKDTTVEVYVDDQRVKLDPPAIMRDGKAYVGLRSAAAALGATVKWDEKTKTAVITAGNKRTKISQSQVINIKGAMFLPLRVTGEALGCTVEWDSTGGAIKITTEAPCPSGGG
jgi:hypothetical protein